MKFVKSGQEGFYLEDNFYSGNLSKEDQMIFSLEYLTCMRYGTSDEVPTEIIHSISPNNRYKVRVYWWCGVRDCIEDIQGRTFLPKDVMVFYHQVFDSYFNRIIREDSPRTTREDIQMANKFLDVFIAMFENAGLKVDYP